MIKHDACLIKILKLISEYIQQKFKLMYENFMTVDFIVMFASNRFYFLQFLYLDKYNNPHISKTCVC